MTDIERLSYDVVVIVAGGGAMLAEACNACALCALFCPEGAIARDRGAMAVDYDYCKGCGICEVVCPVKNAITMELV